MPQVTVIIQSLVAPVVLISACGLLCLALYNRLAAIVSRLRGFHRERLEALDEISRTHLEQQATTGRIIRGRLSTLEAQVHEVTGRARLIRNALICLLFCVLSMLLCSLALGLSFLTPHAIVIAVGFFVLGVLWMIAGVILALIELTRSLEPVVLEQASFEEVKDTV